MQAAEVDTSKLPPPAAVQVEFLRDIQPILEASCLRCHGPEKPKSGYRLDNRAAAIKGGETGVAILPGRSAESPLIHYVARLVDDMEMPPPGKGEALTKDQIALLRAWIDQGASWTSASPTNSVVATVSPTAGWLFVSGDNQKFREHYWQRDGFQGGIESLDYFEQVDADTRAWMTARALRDDYKMTLKVERKELGFVSTGWEQYRKYYDDTGGYFGSPPLSLDRDLHLDLGKAWIDVGLTLPHWPRMVLGYEYDYKQGNEAITSWGSNGAAEPRNLAPASKYLDEGVHVIKFDLDAEVKGWLIEDRFRGEFYHQKTHYTNVSARSSVTQDVHKDEDHFQGANSIRLEKKLTSWLLGSGGYFYSKLDADDSFSDVTTGNGSSYPASVPQIELTRETHLFNLNSLAGPFDGLTVSAGAQSEWTRQHGFGRGILNGIGYTRGGASLMTNAATLSADYDQNTITENFGLRYSKIPFTSLFADARFKQESIDQSTSDIQASGPSFVENPSYSSQMADFRAGFNTSPWRQVSLSAHYRYYVNNSHYKTNDVPQPEGGYPGLIRQRELMTDEVETRLVVRPVSWLKTTLSYKLLSTDYNQDMRPAYDGGTTYSSGGHILAGSDDSHIYSIGLVLTPRRRWALSATFSYQDSKTTTASSGTLRPYQGEIYSTLLGGTYILNPLTDLSLNYSFSFADYSDSTPNPSGPPPLGIRYDQHAVQASISRHISKNMTTRLAYAFYRYDEPTVAGVNDYTVHAVFATLSYRFP